MSPRRRRPIDIEDDGPDAPEPTARPSDGAHREQEQEEELVPESNMTGAAPTALGLDSGGDLPGPGDDLGNLVEPEPPEPPEVGAVHVRGDVGPQPPRRRR